jgi:solute carrier family 20 (sodium-dependent phosphate transporter)
MAVLHQYDYIFALTVIFACLDAWNIGKSFEYLAGLR